MLHNGHLVEVVGKIWSFVRILSRRDVRLRGQAGLQVHVNTVVCGRAEAVFDLVIRVISGHISNSYCGGTARVLSLFSFAVGISVAEAVLAEYSGTASVLRRAISAAKVSIIDESSTVRVQNSTCTAFGAFFEYPNVYRRHPRCNFPLIATVTLTQGSESTRTRASWNARFNSLCSFSLLACHDLYIVFGLATILNTGADEISPNPQHYQICYHRKTQFIVLTGTFSVRASASS